MANHEQHKHAPVLATPDISRPGGEFREPLKDELQLAPHPVRSAEELVEKDGS